MRSGLMGPVPSRCASPAWSAAALLSNVSGGEAASVPAWGRAAASSWHLALLPVLLVFGGRDVAQRAEKPPGIEPAHPPGGGRLDRGDGLPRAAAVDQLGLGQADDRFRQGVIAVAFGPDRGDCAGFGEPAGVADRQVPRGSLWWITPVTCLYVDLP
jgi:hypothetical protein